MSPKRLVNSLKKDQIGAKLKKKLFSIFEIS